MRATEIRYIRNEPRVSKRRCQSYFISRRSPHHGISKDSDLCASAIAVFTMPMRGSLLA